MLKCLSAYPSHSNIYFPLEANVLGLKTCLKINNCIARYILHISRIWIFSVAKCCHLSASRSHRSSTKNILPRSQRTQILSRVAMQQRTIQLYHLWKRVQISTKTNWLAGDDGWASYRFTSYLNSFKMSE